MEIMFAPIAGWDVAKGKVRVVGAGEIPGTVISLHDVAEFVVLATELPEMKNRALPLGGPDAITAMDAVAAGQGRYGAILWVKPRKVRKAAEILGAS